MRLDRWLWFARFFKTRSLAAKLVSSGRVRVNSTRVAKPAFSVGPEDTLTFPQADRVRVIRINGLAIRRGPASEAQTLYSDLTPEPDPNNRPLQAAPHGKNDAKGRPTKRNRRKLMADRREMLE